MTIKFLGQGFEAASANAIGNYLISYLNQTNFHSFTGISAFASEAGIFGLAGHILNAKQIFQAPQKITLVVGVDQQGTSKEALEELKNLNVASYIFYQSEAPIFHPKIYLFEGDQQTKLIVGSSNLTGTGLFMNVEGSFLIEFDNNELEGIILLNELKTYYQTLFDLTDRNLFPISDAIIADFVAKGIVPDETTRRRNYNAKVGSSTQQPTEQQSHINVPRRRIATIPSSFPRKPRAASTATPASTTVTTQISNGEQTSETSIIEAASLLWESGPLKERDLNIPKGNNTAPTGSMLFKKGKTEGIDQRHYFRDVIFSSLDWVFNTRKGATHLEKAAGLFRIIVLGTDCGTFALTLTHNPRTDTRTYEENNSMTAISWGDAKTFIAREELIGRSAKLYGGSTNGEYVLVIE